jgi:aquaporin Z
MDMPRRLGAEFFGTFWLTFAGCGSAVLAAGFPALGIGFLGVSLAFGLTVLTMAYAVLQPGFETSGWAYSGSQL